MQPFLVVYRAWNIPRVTYISCYTHSLKGSAFVYQENKSDSWDIPRYTTRKRWITSIYPRQYIRCRVIAIFSFCSLVPSLMREGSYSTIRLGAYEPLKLQLGATDIAHTPLWKKIAAGAVSGTIGSAIATPTDLVKVRFQAVGPAQQSKYRNTFHAFWTIARTEGIRGLWTGVGPTVQRAAILTAAQIPSYDHTKHTLLNAQLMVEGPALHGVSSVIAGFVTACSTSPFDVAKTRMMNQKKDVSGAPLLYKNTIHCLAKIIRHEGMLGLYKGFIPNWMRIGPHTIVTFFVFERLRSLVGMSPV